MVLFLILIAYCYFFVFIELFLMNPEPSAKHEFIHHHL